MSIANCYKWSYSALFRMLITRTNSLDSSDFNSYKSKNKSALKRYSPMNSRLLGNLNDVLGVSKRVTLSGRASKSRLFTF